MNTNTSHYVTGCVFFIRNQKEIVKPLDLIQYISAVPALKKKEVVDMEVILFIYLINFFKTWIRVRLSVAAPGGRSMRSGSVLRQTPGARWWRRWGGGGEHMVMSSDV